MGKALGMMACTTVVAVGLWITNGGDSPTSAAAGIQSSGTSSSPDTNRTPATESYTAANDSTVRSGYRGVSAVRGQSPDDGEYQFDGSTSQKVPFDSPEKRQAVQLIKSARRDIQSGHYEVARKKALEAREIKAKYALFEDNPQLLLSEIERRTGNLAFGPESSSNDVVNAAASTTSTGPAPVHQVGFSPAAGGAPKDQALALLKAARQEMQGGNLVGAREKAMAAQQIKATYGLFEDNPELLLEDLNRLAAQQAMAAQPGPASSAKQVAQGLVKDARQALMSGQYESAYEKATAAQQMNVAFDLLEDRPESVLRDLDQAMAGQPSSEVQNIATNKPAAPSAADRTDVERARELVREARAALTAGRTDEAWAKASAAEQLNVAFGVVEDRPELILTQIEQMQAGNAPEIRQTASSTATAPFPAESSAAQPNPTAQAKQMVFEARKAMQQGKYEIARQLASQAYELDAVYGPVDDRPELVLADLAQRQAPQTAATAPAPAPRKYASAVPNVDPVYPAGMSADQLYEIGMSHLSGGNPTAAREAFMMAYKSQDQLTPRRRQQVQDFLRELNPGAGNIQLASNQGTAPNQLDLVDQQRAIQYDRLRSEVMNAVFRAERLKEDDPDQALSVLDQALANVESSELGEEAAKGLINSIQRTQASVSSFKEQQAPLLEMKRRNEETLSYVQSNIETKIRIEQELAKLVDEYNKLMDERRYAEAEIIAKQAVELDPENPVSVVMEWKALYQRQNAFNRDLKRQKDENFTQTLNEVELSILNPVVSDSISYPDAKSWKEMKERRDRFGTDNRERTAKEKSIEESLSRPISLQFDGAPMTDVMKHIANMLGITIYVDIPALAEVGVQSNTPVSIDVDGIMLKSALNLILQPLELGYTIEDEVLKITNRQRQQGKQIQVVYPVADLVVPLTNLNQGNFGAPFQIGAGLNGAGGFATGAAGLNGLNVGIGGLGGLGGMQFQMDDNGAFAGGNPFANSTAREPNRTTQVNFAELSDLITKTVEPDSWQEFNGNGSLETSESTLSLVIRQTQEIHDKISDLLSQLRRLQDLQVTIEVRVITVSNNFFEQIGVDFDFQIQDTVPGEEADLPPFGAPGQGQAQQNQGNQNQNQNQASTSTFDTLTPALTPQDRWGSPTIVGLNADGTFRNDLDVAFNQGSFEIGVPDFGGFSPEAGAQVGLAILSDIEAFFFIRAAQGDSRTNVLAAPKVTLFNGQTATVTDSVTRPFVAGFTPIVGVGAVGFQPIILPLNDGVFMTVAAVISADRRYVRLSVSPFISTVLDIVEFSVPGGATSQFGNNNQGGGGGQNQQNQQGAAGNVTIQQPIVDILNVTTTVSVPDGGTVLLGGVKRLKEGRSMAGVPILNKLPYLSRLFKNSGVGRETESIMLMVTPRIIIQEEEEALLGIPQ